jgi:hypothetical protein
MRCPSFLLNPVIWLLAADLVAPLLLRLRHLARRGESPDYPGPLYAGHCEPGCGALRAARTIAFLADGGVLEPG